MYIINSIINFVSGSGSGSTPSLMGNLKEGLFVVITDDSAVVNLVVFDASTGAEADRIHVDFGDKTAKETITEQSVLINKNKLGNN